jgi:hypothetical protein
MFTRDDVLARGRRSRRNSSRWDTDFGRWIDEFGGVSAVVAALGRDPELSVSQNTVYEWLRGHAPHPTRAYALVEISGGRLTLDDIYSQPRQIQQASRDESPSRREPKDEGSPR